MGNFYTSWGSLVETQAIWLKRKLHPLRAYIALDHSHDETRSDHIYKGAKMG